MNIRGLLQPFAAATLLSVCLSGCSCSDNSPKTAPEPEPAAVAEVPAPVTAEAPPQSYKGPVKGLFLDGELLPMEFTPEDVVWDKARIDFNIGEEPRPEAGIRLAWLNRDRYAVPFGMNYKVDKDTRIPPTDKFEIWIRYKILDTRAPKQQQVKGDYTLDLVLDPDSGEGGLKGYVNFESSDPPLVLRGRFEARLKGFRSDLGYGHVDLKAASPATMSHLFHKRFVEQYPDTELEVLKFMGVRRQKTINKEMRVGYAEFRVNIDGEKTYRSALLVLTPEGWECVEILEPTQIPEAFPIIEPQAPPNGNLRYYVEFATATHVQATSSGENIFNYKCDLLFGGMPIAWCSSKVSYRTGMEKQSTVVREFVMRKSELGWTLEQELLPGEVFDQPTGVVSTK